MIIVANSKPLMVQFKMDGKLYGTATDGGTAAPFEEVHLQVGEQVILGDDDVLVRASPMGADTTSETSVEG